MTDSHTTLSTDDLIAWLSQEKLWGDVHRQPYFKAIKARLEAAQQMADEFDKVLIAIMSRQRANIADATRAVAWKDAGQ